MKILFLFCLILFLPLFGCSSETQEGVPSPPLPVAGSDLRGEVSPAYGDLLIQGSIGDASNLIPMLATDSASHDIAGMIFNGLVKYSTKNYYSVCSLNP